MGHFARAVGGDTERAAARRRPSACTSWTAGRDTLEGLVAAYTIESGQPAISQTKLDGLRRHYGLDEGPATEYFSLHAELDLEHAAHSRALIEDRLTARITSVCCALPKARCAATGSCSTALSTRTPPDRPSKLRGILRVRVGASADLANWTLAEAPDNPTYCCPPGEG